MDLLKNQVKLFLQIEFSCPQEFARWWPPSWHPHSRGPRRALSPEGDPCWEENTPDYDPGMVLREGPFTEACLEFRFETHTISLGGILVGCF